MQIPYWNRDSRSITYKSIYFTKYPSIEDVERYVHELFHVEFEDEAFRYFNEVFSSVQDSLHEDSLHEW